MIIPYFFAYQDDEYVIIDISAPNASLHNTKFDLTDQTVVFTSPPYHLRINLPSYINLNGKETCEWDSKTNNFKLKLLKLKKNEHFKDLDMISKLLIGNREQDLRKINLIDVVDIDSNEKFDEKFDFDNEIMDSNFFNNVNSIINAKYNYGFLNRYNNIIEKYQDELWNLSDLKNPGDLDVNSRRNKRFESEEQNFNEEYYLSCTFNDLAEINKLIEIHPDWLEYIKNDKTYSQDELLRLKELPKKEFKLCKNEKVCMLYGLIDILFAYCYDKRINLGENNVESAWNISKLSSTLSFFDCFWCLEDVLIACFRRSLCYPLYRNYKLSQSCFNDVIKLLKNGKSYIIKVLLCIQKVFNNYGEFKYLLNDLYINDYLICIQFTDERYFSKLINSLEYKIKLISKEMVDLDIPLLEECAELTILENTITEKIVNMEIK